MKLENIVRTIVTISFVVCVITGIAHVGMAKELITFQHNDTPQSGWQKGFEFIEQYVEERLPNFDIKIYHSGQLAQHDWSLILEQVQEQVCHAFVEFPGTYATLDDRFFTLMLPYLFDNREHWARFWENPPQALLKWIDELEEKQNIRIVEVWTRNFRGCLNTVRPIHAPEDYEGIVFRVPDLPLFIDIYELLKAKPVPMSSGEIYTALQMGAIQGEDNSPPTVYTFKSYEQAKYYTVTEYIGDGALLSVNSEWWNGLKDEERAVFQEAFKKAGQVVYKYEGGMFDTAIQGFKDSGVEVNFLTPEEKDKFREVLRPIYDKMSEKVGEVDFKEILDAVNAAR